MKNKRGKVDKSGFVVPVLIIIAIVLIMIILDNALEEKFDIIPREGMIKEHLEDSLGFHEIIWFENEDTGVDEPIEGLKFLNYIFGTIPKYLDDLTGNTVSAAIIIIAIWVAFFLIFKDILSMFGGFSEFVNWTVAGAIALIGANLKAISLITIYFLTLFAVFGSLAILFSMLVIFFLFIGFHFGGAGLRRWIVLRRAEDSSIRAVAGGKKAASAVEVLREIADEAEHAGKHN